MNLISQNESVDQKNSMLKKQNRQFGISSGFIEVTNVQPITVSVESAAWSRREPADKST
jgi:hypothetical protein